MKFITNINKSEYESFVKKHNKSHFLQSHAWGEFSKLSKNLTPHYVGLKDNKNKLIATALLLEKKLPLGFSYFYSPRGFVIDFSDKELLSFFVKEIKNYIKNYKAIFLKIDPDIIWSKNNYDNEDIKIDESSKKIFESLTSLEFKHQGFTKNFETMQPRYTFRIDFNKPYEEIENNFSKTTKQRIKKATSLDTIVKIGNIKDIETFNNLMTITENRKDFVSHDLDYYKNLYKIYNEENSFNIFLGSINLNNIIKKYEDELKIFNDELELLPKENLSKSQNNKKKELEKTIKSHKISINEYKKAKEENGSEIVLNGHAIIEYGDKAWVLYAGNHNILTSTYSNYKTYEEHIKYCYNKGIKMYDQFGTTGDLSKDNPRLGLHEFKKKFGGDYIEFIGEFDLVTNKIMYFIFTKLVPIYRNIIKNIAKRKKREQ